MEDNFLGGAASFIGTQGPNCTKNETVPQAAAFVIDWSVVSQSTIQTNFQNVSNADDLICVVPPSGGAYWPYGKEPESSNPSSNSGNSVTVTSGSSAGRTAGIVVGVLAGVVSVALLTWYIRKWAIAKRAASFGARPRLYNTI